jgi:hypothetical protein
VPNPLTRHELDLVALTHFRQMGHDNQHRLFKFFGWEEAKTKAANGGYTDYPRLASGKLDRMTAAEIGKFLVACALAGDLYCPNYSSGPTLAKDSTLAREAAHYRVNTKRILSAATEKLKKESGKHKTTSKPRSGPPRKR